jgi:hypothetical protein
MPDNQRHYGKWTRDQLLQAESTASQFLEEHSAEIAETMRAKAKFLETLFQRIATKSASFDQRLEYFARVSEIARLIQEDADGFFELASQPAVARILNGVSKPQL